MSEKPLVRWTVGPPKSRFDDAILRRSVLNFRKIYGDRFELAICVNGRDGEDLKAMGVRVFRQSPEDGMPDPQDVAWKLYPPRLKPHAHEIFIDHDVVLVDRIEKFDLFLSQNDAFFYSQAFSTDGCYGCFRETIPAGFRLNSGLFGLPPGFRFDFSGVHGWSDYFDEQGFVASSLCRQSKLIRVDLEELWICADDRLPAKTKGFHFCRANRDRSWPRFVRSTTL